MSTSAASAGGAGLGDTLRREITAARERVEGLVERRRELDRMLSVARAAETAARHSLSALENIAREAGELVESTIELGVVDDGLERLAGGVLRERIARVALRRQRAGQPVHWSEWHAWLRQAGFEAAGKNPQATFQTQLARSPLVRRYEREGVYVLDLQQFPRARKRLGVLHEQLSQLPAPDQMALLGDLRAQRRELQTQVGRTERALEEMWRVLAQEHPEGWSTDGDELMPERVVAAWLTPNPVR